MPSTSETLSGILGLLSCDEEDEGEAGRGFCLESASGRGGPGQAALSTPDHRGSALLFAKTAPWVGGGGGRLLRFSREPCGLCGCAQPVRAKLCKWASSSDLRGAGKPPRQFAGYLINGPRFYAEDPTGRARQILKKSRWLDSECGRSFFGCQRGLCVGVLGVLMLGVWFGLVRAVGIAVQGFVRSGVLCRSIGSVRPGRFSEDWFVGADLSVQGAHPVAEGEPLVVHR
ncbi:hypothetical protein L7F22_040014 [Adiantum nelumboides]|nr:hypothetical protein [Adiantum nelumboides]